MGGLTFDFSSAVKELSRRVLLDSTLSTATTARDLFTPLTGVCVLDVAVVAAELLASWEGAASHGRLGHGATAARNAGWILFSLRFCV